MKIKKLNNYAKIPTRGSEGSAGYDLYACIPDGTAMITIQPHETVVVGTGLAIQIPHGYFGGIFARSGLAKYGVRPSNCVGVCDEDYTGEYMVSLHNDSNEPRVISHMDRIAQLIILPYATVNFEVVDELDCTKRGDGGFGSTGLK